MGKGKKFQFVVGNTDKWCSKPWRVKFNRDDVYIMCGDETTAGKYHKISLHKSGTCHSAITWEKMSQFNLTPEQRTALQWQIKPKEGESFIAFTILIAFDQLDDRTSAAKEMSGFVRIPTPPIFSSAVILFIKTNSQGKPIHWDLAPGVHLLYSEDLPSGNTVSIVYYYTNAFNHLIKQCTQLLHEKADENPPPAPLRASSGFVTVTDSNGNYYHKEIKL